MKLLLDGGLQSARTVVRVVALRQLAEGQTIRRVAANLGLTPKTVWLVSQRYRQRGLVGKPRPEAVAGKKVERGGAG